MVVWLLTIILIKDANPSEKLYIKSYVFSNKESCEKEQELFLSSIEKSNLNYKYKVSCKEERVK